MEKSSKILITGASGLIGSALVRLLMAEGYENLLTPTSLELGLCDWPSVFQYFSENRPEYVFHLAAHVGGIESNSIQPVEFIYNNTLMQSYMIETSWYFGVKKLLFPGSACAYPKDAQQPIKEESFLTGMPEPTNIAYAAAKINGIIMAQSYAKQYGMNVVLPMVANTYGIGDKSSHVIPHMIKIFDGAARTSLETEVNIWGSGKPIREFIYADDVASAFLFLMLNYNSSEIINVGTKEEISIENLAKTISSIFNYGGKIGYNSSKPDGAMRKCLDSSRIRAMGWEPKVNLEDGLRRIINDL